MKTNHKSIFQSNYIYDLFTYMCLLNLIGDRWEAATIRPAQRQRQQPQRRKRMCSRRQRTNLTTERCSTMARESTLIMGKLFGGVPGERQEGAGVPCIQIRGAAFCIRDKAKVGCQENRNERGPWYHLLDLPQSKRRTRPKSIAQGLNAKIQFRRCRN